MTLERFAIRATQHALESLGWRTTVTPESWPDWDVDAWRDNVALRVQVKCANRRTASGRLDAGGAYAARRNPLVDLVALNDAIEFFDVQFQGRAVDRGTVPPFVGREAK